MKDDTTKTTKTTRKTTGTTGTRTRKTTGTKVTGTRTTKAKAKAKTTGTKTTKTTGTKAKVTGTESTESNTNTTTTGTNTTSTNTTKTTTSNLQANDANTFRPYDSALPVPELKGLRNVKLLYKAHPTTKLKAAENSYIRVQDYITEQLVCDRVTDLAPYIVTFLRAEEDKLIKKYHIAGATTVMESDLDVDKIIEALELAGAGTRLTKEKIESWFDDGFADVLTTAIADKTGVALEDMGEEELHKVEAILNAYKNKLSALASPKVVYRKEEAEKLIQAINLIEDTGYSNFITKKLLVKLVNMTIDTVDSLLFYL